MCARVWGNTAVCCRIHELCFLAAPIMVKKFKNCANQLLKTNSKVIFRQEIFSVVNSSRLQATLDLVFLSYRIQAILALIWAIPPEGVLMGGRDDKVRGCGECLDLQGSLEWNMLALGLPSPAGSWLTSSRPGLVPLLSWFRTATLSPTLIHVSPGWLTLPSWQRGVSGLPLLCLFWIYILSWG